MKYEAELADQLLSIPREMPRRPDVQAWAKIDPVTGLAPVYRGSGKLWFVIGPDGRTLRMPSERDEERPKGTSDDYIAWLHSRADASTSRGKCYFIGGDTGAIKIGFTIDLASRFKAIQACSPIPLRILATRDGGEMREAAYHAQFAEHRMHYEWFAPHADILAEIERLAV